MQTMGGFDLTSPRAENKTGYDANRGADGSAKHHVLEQCLTRHVREQAGTPADERSEYQAYKAKADKIAE